MMDDPERAARRSALLAEFGSEAAILRPTLRERDLHSAAAMLTVRGQPGSQPSLMGWTGGRAADMPPEVRSEIGAAVRLPLTVSGTLEELVCWRRRLKVLALFQGEADPPLWLKARLAILEQRLDTLPPQSRADIVARLRWVLETMTSELDPDEAARLARLRVDLDECVASGLLEVSAEPEVPLPMEPEPGTVQIGHPTEAAPQVSDPSPRTGAEKRRAILELLQAGAEAVGAEPLTDREIARRVGCSPQTVGNVRKALVAAQGEAPR